MLNLLDEHARHLLLLLTILVVPVALGQALEPIHRRHLLWVVEVTACVSEFGHCLVLALDLEGDRLLGSAREYILNL